MSALDRVLRLAADDKKYDNALAAAEDTAGEMVRAAAASLTEIRAYLAGDQDDDEDQQDGDDHSSHPTFKALKKRGMDESKARSMCAKADKRVKAARQADAALLCLASLAAPDGDWVAASSHGLLGAQAPYADPGWRGRKNLPLDTGEHTRLSLAYANLAGYSPPQLETVRERAVAAARGFGLTVPDDDDRVAATALLELSVLSAEDRRKPGAHTIGDSEDFPIPDKAHLTAAVARYKQGKLAGHSKGEVAAHIRHHAKRLGEEVDLAGSPLEEAADLCALAKPVGDGGIIMNHGPFTGTHEHGHFQSAVHGHPHQHFGDNSHDGGPAHRNGSKPGGRAGW
jgi:hypothetical protein